MLKNDFLIGVAELALAGPDVGEVPKIVELAANRFICFVGETTKTTLAELTYGEWISPYIQSYAGQYKNPSQFLAKWDPQNGSSTVSVPAWVSDQGTPNDDGAAVDTEFDTTEAAEIDATELETEDATFSIAEYGMRRDPTDTVIEDAISAEAIVSHIAADGASTLMASANDDVCALFAAFTGQSGSTGVDLSIATMSDALYDLAERGAKGTLVGILDHEQARNFLDALEATSTSLAVYAGAVDRSHAAQFSPDQGRNDEGFVIRWKGCDFYRQGMTDTANAGADVVGAIFVRGDEEANRPYAAIGQGSRREFRLEPQRDASKRTTEMVMTMRWGAGITRNNNGQELLSDAP